MNTPIEFIVNGFLTGFAGEQRIIGRCGDVSLRVGDVFDSLRSNAESAKSVHLEVIAIQAYGRNLQELGFGMTGAIDVRGEGIGSITPSCVLFGAIQDENRDSAVAAAASQHA